MIRNSSKHSHIIIAALVAVVVTGCAQQPSGPPPRSTIGLSIGYPSDGQVLAGTVGILAAGYGGAATDLTFTIGSIEVTADGGGAAYLDTRALPDGDHVLSATAVVAGVAVEDEVQVRILNDLADSATVGAAGGAVGSAQGSIARVPPGAFQADTTVTVDDTTEARILDEFGIDYSAMGVTFLGALEVDTSGAPPELPLEVDLAGWSQAVQPGQDVVMFLIAPDADGDGQGELTFGSNAVATPGGSIVTTPTPRSETYGFQSPAGLSAQATVTVRPGEVLTLTGRGFNQFSPLSNVARYGPLAAPTTETLLYAARTGPAGSNALQELSFAVPALPTGTQQLRLRNLTTGHVTSVIDLSVLAPGSATQQTWQDFVAQIEDAVTALAVTAELSTRAGPWLTVLEGANSGALAAMAANSGLVSSTNAARMNSLEPGSLGAGDRELVAMHALVLDAMASTSSVPTAVADAAADLATLLTVAAHMDAVPAVATISALQASGATCSSAPTGGSSISWGEPVVTGMGSAPPASCGAGSATGDGTGGSGLRALAAIGGLDSQQLATTSLRRGTFGPMSGAVVRVMRPGTDTSLAAFTAVTDATGYFHVPFMPPNEPYLLRAYHPASGQVATLSGVSNGDTLVTSAQLVFQPQVQGPGTPTAHIAVVPVSDDSFEGTAYYRFDGTGSTDDQEIVEYSWDFGGAHLAGPTSQVLRGYGRNGTYSVQLIVMDSDNNFDSITTTVTIDDLPYDYWAEPPLRVSEDEDGERVELTDTEDLPAAISGSGRYVAFRSRATVFPDIDTNSARDTYLKDLETGELELVTTDENGVAVGSGQYFFMSDDARYVAFDYQLDTGRQAVIKDRSTGAVTAIPVPSGFDTSWAVGLSGDGRSAIIRALNPSPGVSPGWFLVRLDTMETTRIVRNMHDTAWVQPLTAPTLSFDGRYVVFETVEGDLVPGDVNGVRDVFRLDSTTGEIELISEAQDGTRGDKSSAAYGRAMSADGRYVTFISSSTTWPGATANDEPYTTVGEAWIKDMVTGELYIGSTNAAGVSGDDDAGFSGLSADGRYLAFGSLAQNLTPLTDPTDPCDLQLCPTGFSYVKDLMTGRVANVTVGVGDALANTGQGFDDHQAEPTISADGRYIAFYSWSSNLVEGDDSNTLDYFRVENPLWQP